MVGKSILKKCPDHNIIPVSYRNEIPDVFGDDGDATLIHAAWSCNTRTSYDEIERVYENDLFSSKRLFDKFSEKNPDGKIIFLSTAGAVYKGYERTVTEEFIPNPVDLYGETKMQVENILKTVNCKTVSLRISNIWGVNGLPSTRKNGLVDKLIDSLDKDIITEIYANLDTRIDIIHINDLIDLIMKVVDHPCSIPHQMFLVGSESLTIKEVIDRISAHGSLLLKLKRSENKSYLHIESRRARNTFDWKPENKL